MTAYRVLDDHRELDNIGTRTHDEIDVHIDASAFLIVSGVSSNVPTLGRLLAAGTNITLTDNGPGSTLVISVSGSVSGSSSPGGANTQIQFNDSGSFGGVAGFTFEKSSNSLTVNNISGSLTRLSDGSSYLRAGSNVTITSGSNGSITISSTGGGGSSTITSWMETPAGDVDGANMIFTLANTPLPSNALLFYVNGILQLGANNDYVVSGDTITMTYAPTSGSNVVATYPYAATVQNTMWAEVPVGNTDGYNYIFTLSSSPSPSSGLMFYVNGVLQKQGVTADYTLAGPTVTMNYIPSSGSNLLATYPY